MNEIATLIKRAALDAVESSYPVAVMYGTVSSATPLVINIEQKLQLRGEMLVSINMNKTFNVGDSVALLREQGGQRFIILGVCY
jgi:hypothetical protein